MIRLDNLKSPWLRAGSAAAVAGLFALAMSGPVMARGGHIGGGGGGFHGGGGGGFHGGGNVGPHFSGGGTHARTCPGCGGSGTYHPPQPHPHPGPGPHPGPRPYPVPVPWIPGALNWDDDDYYDASVNVIYSLPANCETVKVNGSTYSHCGSTWYQKQFQGNQVAYVVVANPN